MYNETKAEGFLSVFAVALLAEGVDRNRYCDRCFDGLRVALLAEGVDRNGPVPTDTDPGWVALLAEGVDRNDLYAFPRQETTGRPPRGGRG